MASLALDTTARRQLVTRLCAALRGSFPASTVLLRGSLATRRADAYSDIDLLWELPDADFDACLAAVAAILAAVQPLESLREDIDLQRSPKRRLLFARFAELPLFWRLDLDVYARSAGRDPHYDLGNPSARGERWSWTESALNNAVAAIKAHLRGDDATARQLLERAFGRVGLEPNASALAAQIGQLAAEIPRRDAAVAAFASRIAALAADVFGAAALRACE
jgi:hypothetical protein